MSDNMIGAIDEMRVYSQSLQTGEVEKIYADGLEKHRDMVVRKDELLTT
jgi:hypothetical protein